ncbi:DUF7331 family protein [Natrialbaceae archaeon A-gly3]
MEKLNEPATEPANVDLERYVSYEGEESTVICDRRMASAWIRSSVVVSLER